MRWGCDRAVSLGNPLALFSTFQTWRTTPASAVRWSTWIAGCVFLAACATNSGTPAPPPKAPAQASLQELMQRAEASAKANRLEASRLEYREAAKAYPTSVLPWSKLAEDYFEKGDHGNAILAAQEVVQREPQNVVAQSVLAVSGLRVSNAALTSLRAQQSGVPTSTREQATALTRTLREALGEYALVPRQPTSGDTSAATTATSTATATAGATTSTAPARSKPSQAPAKPAAKPAVKAAAPAAPAPAKSPAPASTNPFDKLK
jgi:tetratricopeptide (TPR) repeat protein